MILSIRGSFYSKLPKKAFWKNHARLPEGEFTTEVFKPKWNFDSKTKIATAGSCFAQNISKALFKLGITILDVEPPPLNISDDLAKSFGYKLYSARYGNIYSVKHLLQLCQEAFGRINIGEICWNRPDNRFVDAFRPSIEPKGFSTKEEVEYNRNFHLIRVKSLFQKMELFIFTLGLTEAWVDIKTNLVFPTIPGAIAGKFNEDKHKFINFDTQDVITDFLAFRSLIKEYNPECKFLLTVSPVPLVATATGSHIVVANSYSKSVLRVASEKLRADYNDIDYFPSYEIVTDIGGVNKFVADRRSVSPEAINQVMSILFKSKIFGEIEHQRKGNSKDKVSKSAYRLNLEEKGDALFCDELILEKYDKDGLP